MERQIESLRLMLEETRKDLKVVQMLTDKLDKALFGNGQPGVISKLEEKVQSHDRWIWLGTGVVIAMQFLSGTGVISLKAFIGK